MCIVSGRPALMVHTNVCRTYGRIVETVMEDITATNGGGLLTVTVQNTGYITGDFSVCGSLYLSDTLIVSCIFQVGVDECSEGIVRVAQQTKSLDPRQQALFEWEISAGLNTDLDHNCTGNTLITQELQLCRMLNYNNYTIFHDVKQWCCMTQMESYWMQSPSTSKHWTHASTALTGNATAL